MKNILPVLLAVATVAALPARSASFADPGGAGDFSGGNLDLDLLSVDVNNDASTLTFTINLAGNPMNATWYNYYVGISRNLFGGVGGNLNGTGGWGKDIQMSTGGMDFFIGAYPGFNGYSLLTWLPSAWTTASGVASQSSSTVTIPVSLSALGLNPGDSFTFDVWTSTSGTDTVLDALSDGAPRSWGTTPFDTGANALTYTTLVPEPGALALVGLGCAVLLRRARR